MPKILMVDDDKEFLEATKMVLESQGYNTVLSENVKQAEECIEKEKPDLIFLDIMIEQPDDGIAFAHKLRKQGVKTPIVMLSAVSKVTGYQYGKCDVAMPCDDFLEKPINPQELIKKVNNILKK